MSQARAVSAWLLAVVIALYLAAAATAAAPRIKLRAQLVPETLGAGTTLHFGFRITAPDGLLPPPLTVMDLRYPANIGIIESGLGLATCTVTALENIGPEGCSPNALMGYGNATVEMPFGPEVIEEKTTITTWMAAFANGHLELLFNVDGESPVNAERVLQGTLLEAPKPYGGDLHTQIPLIEALPEGPFAVVVQMNITLGPQHITYYTRIHGKRIAYHPNGLRLPTNCPHGGFPFAATFEFIGGMSSTSHTTVPCPQRGSSRPSGLSRRSRG
jgi:hypothetical protein